ncbi:MAG: ribosome biogenesis GTPase Der [Chloroflexota bacterium]|nr:MAG: ribosome biogenesis GTPase Der [Chloroflexota bacterium]
MSGHLVAIVGRPNVGKSTLFNRLVGRQTAIVEDQPGTTRDRVYGDVEWSGRTFALVDTGGIVEAPQSELGHSVKAQARLAIDEADLLVFCVDVVEGVTGDDRAVADVLRRSGKPIVLAATKADNQERRISAANLYELGFDEVIPLSSQHGTGTGDLLDWIVARLPPDEPEPETSLPRIAIIGRPNVGKSSLLNALLDRERAIVSAVPGTTRDALDTPYSHGDRELILVDTAGIRRRGRVEVGVEKYSVLRAIRAIGRSDVALLVMDASEGVTAQDTHLAGYVLDSGRACILVLNKWDLRPKENAETRDFDSRLEHDFNFMSWAPYVHVSALTRQRIRRAIDLALTAWGERRRRVPTAELNRVLRDAFEAHSPPSKGGRKLRLLYATQAESEPPTIILFVNRVEYVPEAYDRYLENRIRAAFGFIGTPIRLRFRGRTERLTEEPA